MSVLSFALALLNSRRRRVRAFGRGVSSRTTIAVRRSSACLKKQFRGTIDRRIMTIMNSPGRQGKIRRRLAKLVPLLSPKLEYAYFFAFTYSIWAPALGIEIS